MLNVFKIFVLFKKTLNVFLQYFFLVTDEFSKKQTGVLMQSIVSKLISHTLIQVNIYQFILFSIVYFKTD